MRLAVVGYGFAGRSFHSYLIGLVPGLELRGVVSRSGETRAKVLAEHPGAVAYASLEEALADGEVDAVVVATPHDTHHPYSLAALRAGKHVVTDKPMCLNLREAREVYAAAEAAGREVMVFHNRRWDSEYLTLQKVLAEGTLGDVRWIEMAWNRFGAWKSWRAKASSGGGRMEWRHRRRAGMRAALWQEVGGSRREESGQQVRANAARLLECLLVTPGGDGGVVAAEENVGDAPAAIFDRAGVLRTFDEAAGKAVVGRALGIAENAGEEADDGVGDDGGGESAIREDVIADGNFVIHEMVDDALVEALVVAAEEDEVSAGLRVVAGERLVEAAAAGGHEEHAACGCAKALDGFEDRLALQHHALAAAVGRVVGGAVFVARPVAEIVAVEGDETALLSFADHAFSQRCGGDGGEEREDVDAHGREAMKARLSSRGKEE